MDGSAAPGAAHPNAM
uniref:Uncharacterized protein n=1 Tax=Arundo donax TaxID=35708 RepID=A0A0A9Q426_ARUDO